MDNLEKSGLVSMAGQEYEDPETGEMCELNHDYAQGLGDLGATPILEIMESIL